MPETLNDASSRRLNCLIESDSIGFVVTVGHDCAVSDLKEYIQRERLDKLKHIDPHILELWKVNIDLKPHDKGSLRHLKLAEQNGEGVKKLTPWNSIGEYWSDQPPIKHLHIIVKAPTASPAEDDDHDARNPNRKWIVDEPIRGTDMNRCYYVNPGIQDESKDCLEALLRCKFVLLVGARASGKTTRLFWLQRELVEKGYQVIYLSFARVKCDNVQAFWNTFGLAVQAAAFTSPFAVSQDFTPLSSQGDFRSFFRVSAWKRNVVLIIDEFSNLYHANPIVREECLRTFREIRNNQRPYAIRGIIAAGTFGILYLPPTCTTAPFDIANEIRNPYFSIDETRKLFLEFAQDNSITIDDAVIEDVWVKSNGHPGMVCLCGRAISENFHHMIAFPMRVLSYKSWQTFSAIHLHDRVYGHVTFQTMIGSLLREEATPAVNLLRSRFVGFLDTVYIHSEQEQQANFLTAEGVLLKSAPHYYHVASAFVDELIRRYLIPEKFPNAPSTPPSMTSDGRPHVLEVLTQSLMFFEKDLIRLAATQSYKLLKVNIGGLRAVQVPRESVYDTELMRILTNWLGKQKAYAINCQWHLQTDQNKNKDCHIVISKPTTPTVVLELLATGDVSLVRAHIDKTPYYKDLFSADEAWVVHFTCEDDYLDHPTWQSDEQLQREGINVVHFWHDQDFSTVSMSARWKDADGNIKEVNNQHVAL